MSSQRSRARLGQTRRAAAWLLRVATENAGGAVYGAILIGVLLAVEDARSEGYVATIEGAVILLVLFWLTSFYTHTLGTRLQNRETLNVNLLWRSCVYELPIIEGALIPVFALLVMWAAGFTVTGGVNAAVWAAAVTIVVLEIAAGWRSRLDVRRLLLQAGAGAAMGLALIGLKIVFNH